MQSTLNRILKTHWMFIATAWITAHFIRHEFSRSPTNLTILWNFVVRDGSWMQTSYFFIIRCSRIVNICRYPTQLYDCALKGSCFEMLNYTGNRKDVENAVCLGQKLCRLNFYCSRKPSRVCSCCQNPYSAWHWQLTNNDEAELSRHHAFAFIDCHCFVACLSSVASRLVVEILDDWRADITPQTLSRLWIAVSKISLSQTAQNNFISLTLDSIGLHKR